MRRTLPLLLALAAAAAEANFCARDDVPAATLLFPYVEVGVTPEGVPDPQAETTISRIVNVSPNAVVVHFTVWDVTGVPRVVFDEILSGFDALQINWRDFLNGRGDLFDTARTDLTASAPLTRTPYQWGPDRPCSLPGPACTDPLPEAQNRGAVTEGQCPVSPPYGDRSDLAPLIRTLLRGSTVARDQVECGWDVLDPTHELFVGTLGPSPIWFYVTADVVGSCTPTSPMDPAYWNGVARDDNVLIGDVIYLSPAGNRSEMMPAVHIEAAAGAGGGPSVTGFYEERSAGAETRREPLGTAFGFSYASDRWAGIETSLILWKNLTEMSTADDP
ncbi:MAG: hypothetical protein ACOY3Y_14665 [Acidobacteriota bacterium]